jgi:shikimate dehydrogenase
MTFARALGIRGASVTIPFKVAFLERMDEIDPTAARIGAINTVRVEGSRWIGCNYDAHGFLAPFDQRRIALRGQRASVVGAGGSARAVVLALASRGAAVTVHARNQAHAGEVAAVASGRVGPWPPERGSWDLLVNCTPIGMHPLVQETPVPAASLTGRLVYDLVYNPMATRLLREAAHAGCQTIGGLDMLVAQAHEQFQSWTDADPVPGVMRAAAIRRLSEFVSDDHHVV